MPGWFRCGSEAAKSVAKHCCNNHEWVVDRYEYDVYYFNHAASRDALFAEDYTSTRRRIAEKDLAAELKMAMKGQNYLISVRRIAIKTLKHGEKREEVDY